MNLTYLQMKEIENRLNSKLPYMVNIFDKKQLRMSHVRDRIRVAMNWKLFNGVSDEARRP